MVNWVTMRQMWLTEMHAERRLSAHTLSAYGRDLDDFTQFMVTHLSHAMTLDQFVQIPLKDWRSWLAYRQHRGLSARSTARAISVLRGFNRYLQNQEVPYNLALNQLRSPRIKKGLPKPITESQAQELVDDIETLAQESWVGQRDKALMALLYGTGLRIHEALNLNGDVLPLGDSLVIRGKGGKQRIVPLLPAVVEEIETYCQECPFPITSHDPLFRGLKGGRLNPSIVQKNLRLYRRSMGLPEFLTPHALRHSCATHLLGSSNDLRAVQELLGHASLSTTQIYTEVDQVKLVQTYAQAHPRQKRNET
jgi:integrase/recombinase XerC